MYDRAATGRIGMGSRWRTLVMTALLLALVLAAVLATQAAPSILAAPFGPAPSDAIVVLGGDAPPRALTASALWRAGMASSVIVTGDGDCELSRDTLVANGVPIDRVAVECLSGDTWTNAAYTAPLLERSGARSAILVTSWFHTARALRVFRLFCPGIIWSTAATAPVPPARALLSGPDRDAVILEAAKTVVYLARSWLAPPPRPAAGQRCHAGANPAASASGGD
jgi:uncharacterized SAM-binding protein YcdF (DUF218 family)